MVNNSKDLFWLDFWIESQSNYASLSRSNQIKANWHKNGMIKPNLEGYHTTWKLNQIFKNCKDTSGFYNPNSFKDI